MKKRTGDLKQEYLATLAYFQRTVWQYAESARLSGAEYAVALRAWDRLHKAHDDWLSSLSPGEQGNVRAGQPDIHDLEPHRLERDDTVQPEILAALASARLGTPRPKSVRNAVEEAHRILMASRDYLKALPEPKKKLGLAFEAYFGSRVSFTEILDGAAKSDRVPLLPPVQAKRNSGTITSRALEQALKRHAARAPKRIQQEISQALKNKMISCRLLEEIRWQRFRRHFKS